MNLHHGIDKDSGLIHSVVATATNVNDLPPRSELFHAGEDVVYADVCCLGIEQCLEMHSKFHVFRVAIPPGRQRTLPDTSDGWLDDLIEEAMA
jgi:IS5 family transposase